MLLTTKTNTKEETRPFPWLPALDRRTLTDLVPYLWHVARLKERVQLTSSPLEFSLVNFIIGDDTTILVKIVLALPSIAMT
ncbi:hypothetical protein PM082_008815 [Marasmius tenuissimus]|nr:hypothetical protein PM082_008815 [Marasmius tenuissimus]